MGFLRTVTLYNDHWHQNEIRRDPATFVRDLCDAMDRADECHTRCHLGGLNAYPSRHADDHTVFVHYGNSVVDLNGKDFTDRVCIEMPDVAKRYLKVAQEIITWTKRRLKEQS